MHGMAAVAEKPGRIERIFLNEELSSNGIYGVQLYVLGVPTTVVIDDSVPLSSDGSTIFGKVAPDGALWGILLEKAFAKTFGTYEAMISGDPRTSIAMLTGAPSERFYTSNISADDLFDLVMAAN
jgi:calpain-15